MASNRSQIDFPGNCLLCYKRSASTLQRDASSAQFAPPQPRGGQSELDSNQLCKRFLSFAAKYLNLPQVELGNLNNGNGISSRISWEQLVQGGLCQHCKELVKPFCDTYLRVQQIEAKMHGKMLEIGQRIHKADTEMNREVTRNQLSSLLQQAGDKSRKSLNLLDKLREQIKDGVLQARNETPGVPVDQMGAAGLQGTNNNYSIPRGSGRPASINPINTPMAFNSGYGPGGSSLEPVPSTSSKIHNSFVSEPAPSSSSKSSGSYAADAVEGLDSTPYSRLEKRQVQCHQEGFLNPESLITHQKARSDVPVNPENLTKSTKNLSPPPNSEEHINTTTVQIALPQFTYTPEGHMAVSQVLPPSRSSRNNPQSTHTSTEGPRYSKTLIPGTAHKCKLCAAPAFSCLSIYEAHVRTVHASSTVFSCSKCPRTFDTRDKLILHQLAVHEAPQSKTTTSNSRVVMKLLRCTLCPRAFTSKLALDKHHRLHEIGTVCKICEKKCKSERSLLIHMITHKSSENKDKIFHDLSNEPTPQQTEQPGPSTRESSETARNEEMLLSQTPSPTFPQNSADQINQGRHQAQMLETMLGDELLSERGAENQENGKRRKKQFQTKRLKGRSNLQGATDADENCKMQQQECAARPSTLVKDLAATLCKNVAVNDATPSTSGMPLLTKIQVESDTHSHDSADTLVILRKNPPNPPRPNPPNNSMGVVAQPIILNHKMKEIPAGEAGSNPANVPSIKIELNPKKADLASITKILGAKKDLVGSSPNQLASAKKAGTPKKNYFVSDKSCKTALAIKIKSEPKDKPLNPKKVIDNNFSERKLNKIVKKEVEANDSSSSQFKKNAHETFQKNTLGRDPDNVEFVSLSGDSEVEEIPSASQRKFVASYKPKQIEVITIDSD